jgi:hypothetical protein
MTTLIETIDREKFKTYINKDKIIYVSKTKSGILKIVCEGGIIIQCKGEIEEILNQINIIKL